MKTKEFIKNVEKIGLKTESDGDELNILIKDLIIASVYLKSRHRLTMFSSGFALLNELERATLYKLLWDYIEMPVEERWEEKKFYLKHRFLGGKTNNYLNKLGNSLEVLDKSSIGGYQTKFTRAEIDELKEEYNTDFIDFYEEEVEE